MLPTITILENDSFYFSLNNRRLYVLKELRKKGLIPNNHIKVRIKQANMQEATRYVASKCSLNASIMKEYKKSDNNNNNNNDDDNVSDDNNEDNNNTNNKGDDDNDDDNNDNNDIRNQRIKEYSKLKNNNKKNVSDGNNNVNLDPKIAASLKALMKLIDRGKDHQVEQQIATWILSKQINEKQKRYIMDEIGMS